MLLALCWGQSSWSYMQIKKVHFNKIIGNDGEEGFANFVKGAFEDNEEANMKSRNLHKGSSLPQP